MSTIYIIQIGNMESSLSEELECSSPPKLMRVIKLFIRGGNIFISPGLFKSLCTALPILKSYTLGNFYSLSQSILENFDTARRILPEGQLLSIIESLHDSMSTSIYHDSYPTIMIRDHVIQTSDDVIETLRGSSVS